MSAPTDKRILLGRDEAGRLLPGVMPAAVADRFGFSPVAADVDASSSSSNISSIISARPPPMLVRRGGRLELNPCYRLPPRPRPMLARRSDLQPSPSPDDEADDAVGKSSSSSTATDASRNNGISARQAAAAFRIAYPHGRCQGRGCLGVCGGRCRHEPSVLCHCPASNEQPWPRLCVHCKEAAAIRDRAAQRLERLQQQHHDQAIAAE
jgi:hypothetical protein